MGVLLILLVAVFRNRDTEIRVFLSVDTHSCWRAGNPLGAGSLLALAPFPSLW